MTSLIDNDIALKATCYGLIDELLLPVCESLEVAGVLGAARFVISNRIKRMGLNGGPTDALARLTCLLRVVPTVEPTVEEQMMAADFELLAQTAGLALDAGESLLCAIAVSRGIQKLLTGDKRAIAAMEVLLDRDPRLSELCGRVHCLEQLVLNALGCSDNGQVRNAICKQPCVDKALAICSACHNTAATRETMIEALDSYIRDLRTKATRILRVAN